MTGFIRHWNKWSGWYWYLSAIAAWLGLLTAIMTVDGWLS